MLWLLLATAWWRVRRLEVVEMLRVGAEGPAIRAVSLTLLAIPNSCAATWMAGITKRYRVPGQVRCAGWPRGTGRQSDPSYRS